MSHKQICRIFEVMFSITHPAADPMDEMDDVDDDLPGDELDDGGDVENVSVTIACEEPLSLCEFAQRLEASKFKILAERDLIGEEGDGTEVDIVGIEDISHTNLAFLPSADGNDQPVDGCDDEQPIGRLSGGIRIGVPSGN